MQPTLEAVPYVDTYLTRQSGINGIKCRDTSRISGLEFQQTKVVGIAFRVLTHQSADFLDSLEIGS